jgi:acyl-CoA thioester hydrolase
MNKPAYDPDIFPHWMEVPIRFRDLDPLNHVNNAIFSTYYEEARIAFIKEVPAFARGFKNGFSFVLANIQIDFIKPAEFPASLLTGSGIKKLGNSSITSFQAIYHAKTKELISVAQASSVWFDLDKKRPARIPEIENEQNFIVEVENG